MALVAFNAKNAEKLSQIKNGEIKNKLSSIRVLWALFTFKPHDTFLLYLLLTCHAYYGKLAVILFETCEKEG